MAKSAKSVINKKAKPAARSPTVKTAKAARGKKLDRIQTNDRTQDNAIRPGTKLARLIDLLRREDGATIGQLADATGWQAHSVRGAISGTIKKKLGLSVASEKVDGRGRIYRIVAGR